MAVNLSMSGVSILFGTILRFYLVSLNKKLDIGEVIEDLDSVVERGFRFLV
jgi:hypothetical protein